MEAAEPTRHSLDDDVDENVVLDSLRAFHAEYLRREVGLVVLAVQWARLNPGLKRTMPDGSPNTSTGGVHPEDLIWEELAEKGCLHMDDLAIPVFAAAAGLSELQARKLVRESLMLVHLLPRVWHRAQEGHVEIWRVRQLADECWDLTPEAVDYVDRLMSLSTARHTQNGREGVIEEARLRYMREVVEQEELAAQEKRCFNMSTDEWQRRGVADVSGTLDLPDALDLEKAIAAGAEALRKLGSDAPLDVRRSWALGDLARAGQGAFLGLIPAGRPHDRPMPETAPVFRPDCACAMGLRPPGMSAPPSHVLMYVHLTPDAFTTAPGRGAGAGSSPRPGAEPSVMASCQDPPEGTAVPESGSAVARVQGSGVPGGMAVRPELIRSWFTRHRAVPGPKIIFRPVIDLEDHQHVEAYEVPDRLKEAVNLRDGGCVFPWCHRPAYRTDCDHTIAWKDGGKGGPTCTCNLASLCRFHHRAKTHADNHTGSPYTWWTYESLGEGKYLWRGPKGAVLLRTNSGVQDLTTQPAAHTGPGSTTDEAVRRIAADLAELRPAPSPDDENLEFPPPRPVKREPSWRKLIDWYDGDDDPPAANSWRHALRRKTRAKEHPLASLESGYASLANSAEGNIKSPLVDPANPFGSAPYVGLRKTSR